MGCGAGRGTACRVVGCSGVGAPAVSILVDIGGPHEGGPCELLPLLPLHDPRVHAVHLMSDHREPWGGRRSGRCELRGCYACEAGET